MILYLFKKLLKAQKDILFTQDTFILSNIFYLFKVNKDIKLIIILFVDNPTNILSHETICLSI